MLEIKRHNPPKDDMLRIAVPNKGSLSDPAVQLLSSAGYNITREHKALFVTDNTNDVQLDRSAGCRITGQDLLAAGTAETTIELLRLGFGVSKFYFAAPHGMAASITDLDGKRVTTSFPALVRQAANRTRAMVLRTQAQAVMDQLWAVGARAILVTPLEACRL